MTSPAPLRLPRQLISPYHLVHYAVLAFFFLHLYPHRLRPKALSTDLGQLRLLSNGLSGIRHEQEVFVMFLLLLAWKLRRRVRSFDEVWHRLLQHAKLLTLVLTFLCGDRVTLMGVALLYLSMLILLAPPRYRGETRVVSLTPQDFALRMQQQQQQQQQRRQHKNDDALLVLCHAPWHDDCHFFEPVFAALSLEYSSSNELQFASINLDTHAELAEELEIDVSSRTMQLPTILLYYRGQQVRRLPPFKDDGKVVKAEFDKKSVVKYFELDVSPREVSYRKDAPLVVKSGGTPKNTKSKKNKRG